MGVTEAVWSYTQKLWIAMKVGDGEGAQSGVPRPSADGAQPIVSGNEKLRSDAAKYVLKECGAIA